MMHQKTECALDIPGAARWAGAWRITSVRARTMAEFLRNCAASMTSAAWRQLFLPAKGEQRSAAHRRAVLGCCRRPVGGRESCSVGVPIGAEAPAEKPGGPSRAVEDGAGARCHGADTTG